MLKASEPIAAQLAHSQADFVHHQVLGKRVRPVGLHRVHGGVQDLEHQVLHHELARHGLADVVQCQLGRPPRLAKMSLIVLSEWAPPSLPAPSCVKLSAPMDTGSAGVGAEKEP